MRHFCGQRVPILLVATKIDLRKQHHVPKKINPKETQKTTFVPASTRLSSTTLAPPLLQPFSSPPAPTQPLLTSSQTGLCESLSFQSSTSHRLCNVTPLYCCRHHRFCTCYHSRICSNQRLCSGSSGSLNNRDSSFSSGSEHSDCSCSNDSSIKSSSSTTPFPALPSPASLAQTASLPTATTHEFSTKKPASSFMNNSIRTAASNGAFQRHALRSSRRVLPLNSAVQMQPQTASNPDLPVSVFDGKNQGVASHSNAISMNTIYQHNRSMHQTLRSPEIRQRAKTSDLGSACTLASDTAAIAASPTHAIWSGGSYEESLDLITTQEALQLCTEIHASALVECSAQMNIG